jgi:uncharacterized membrane protein
MKLKAYFDTAGLLFGTLFFALSLTPTLLPRGDVVQGVISGFSLAAGYGIGVLGHLLWSYLELPEPRQRIQRRAQWIAAGFCAVLVVAFLWRASEWQNEVRALMDMEEVGSVHPVVVGLVAVAVFLALLSLARLFRHTYRFASRRMQRHVPRRISYVAALVTAFVLFWAVIDGVLFSLALRGTDGAYQRFDALMEPDLERPTDPARAGSAASLLDWEDMGRQGRRFLFRGPTARKLSDFLGEPALEPIRVYVGLNAAETPRERAELALEELRRVGAFERSMLVLVTPTGTGWVDPNAIDTVEYLYRGDIASVAAQYSYLPSPVSLWVEGAYGAEMARALFQAVYGYWTELPRDQRPALYLHGVSLGALNSDRSFDFFDIIADPFQGVLWAGPPFRQETWRRVTERRQPGSPPWLPRFGDGSVVRFGNQQGGFDTYEGEWGTFRIAYLQYASDPVTFYEPAALYREPEWMKEPRGPDVANSLRWFPIVTSLQLTADIIAGSSPDGYGHDYAAEHYLDAWLALTEPGGWSPEGIARLREKLSARE